MIGFTDHQLDTIMRAARALPIEKRDLYLQRVAATLKLRRRFGDSDVAEAAQQALRGLIQQPAA